MAGLLDGKHAVVTGGGRGIGAAIAGTLARHGATITLLGRDRQRLLRQAETLSRAHSTPIHRFIVDITLPDSVALAFSDAESVGGPIHILVNNAGAGESAPFYKTDLELWRRMLDVNLTGAFLCTQAVISGMLHRRWGRIVNVASTAGLTGYPYVTAYCAAKHGLVGLTRALAVEVAQSGITVNAVCPGYTDTDLVAEAVANIVQRTGRTADQARSQLVSRNPQGRLIKPEEVAHTIAWLCLPGSDAITGQAIAVAGGEVM